jgi:hypothetical protein
MPGQVSERTFDSCPFSSTKTRRNMDALKIIGGMLAGAVFALLLAAHHAKRKLPESETRDSIGGVANSAWWWPVIALPIVAAGFLIAGKSGWL